MRKALTLVTMVFFLVTTTGCASKYGEQKTQVNYYPGCYQPIADLRAGENSVARNTGAGALLGAFTGAVVGLLATGGKWQGAAVGAATGGVAGTMAGNLYGRKQQEKNDNIRLASYLQDLDGDISNMDVSTAAARTSLRCYDNQFKVLLADMKARRITRQVAEARFSEIASGREEAIAILGNAAQYGQDLNAQYEQALASEERQMSEPARSGAGKAATVQQKQTLQTARQKNRALSQKVSAVRQEKEAAVADSSSQTREINELYANLDDIRR